MPGQITLRIDNPVQQWTATTLTTVRRYERGVHTYALKRLAEQGRKTFQSRLGAPYARNRPSVSASRGGRAYRTDQRASGSFTFGGATAAFRGSLIREGDTQGFAWPNVDDADKRTKRAWRALEFGIPDGAMYVPLHVWVNASGRGGLNAGELRPINRRATGSRGIRPKYFLRDTWNQVIERDVPQEYVSMVREVFSNASGR